MSLTGRHTLNPTTDPRELSLRATCAEDGHPATTYNPVQGATWCRCGADVTAGDNAPATPRISAAREVLGLLGREAITDEQVDRAMGLMRRYRLTADELNAVTV